MITNMYIYRYRDGYVYVLFSYTRTLIPTQTWTYTHERIPIHCWSNIQVHAFAHLNMHTLIVCCLYTAHIHTYTCAQISK